MAAPPYSSPTVMPSTPRSPILRHRSMGNWSFLSISAARGAISVWAKSCTASRNASLSSPSWKFRPGRFMESVSWKGCSIGFGHGRQRLLHHGAGRDLALCIDVIDLGGGHDDAFTGLDDAAGGADFAALVAGEEIDLVFDGFDFHSLGRHREAGIAASHAGQRAHAPAVKA